MGEESHKPRDELQDRERSRRGTEPASEPPGPKVPASKAKQGRAGWPVLAVLAVGLLLAALAWWGAEIYGVAIEPENPVGDPSQPSTESPAQ